MNTQSQKKQYERPALTAHGAMEQLTQQYGWGWTEALLGAITGTDIGDGSIFNSGGCYS